MGDNNGMKKIIVVVIASVIMSACKQDGGGGSGSGGGTNAAAPTVSKACENKLNRAWVNEATNLAYEFNSDCTGSIPSCDATLEYEIVESDTTGGTINLYVATSTPYNNLCPAAGTGVNCTYDWDTDRGVTRGMFVRCDGGQTVYYRSSYGTY
jgi:hypothetical protein